MLMSRRDTAASRSLQKHPLPWAAPETDDVEGVVVTPLQVHHFPALPDIQTIGQLLGNNEALAGELVSCLLERQTELPRGGLKRSVGIFHPLERRAV